MNLAAPLARPHGTYFENLCCRLLELVQQYDWLYISAVCTNKKRQKKWGRQFPSHIHSLQCVGMCLQETNGTVFTMKLTQKTTFCWICLQVGQITLTVGVKEKEIPDSLMILCSGTTVSHWALQIEKSAKCSLPKALKQATIAFQKTSHQHPVESSLLNFYCGGWITTLIYTPIETRWPCGEFLMY